MMKLYQIPPVSVKDGIKVLNTEVLMSRASEGLLSLSVGWGWKFSAK